MKVLQVMPEFGLAGAERMCEALSLELKVKGIDVSVCSLYDFHSDITDNIEKHDIEIKYLNKKSGFDFSMYHKLKKIIQYNDPDIIHTHRYLCKYVMPARFLARSNASVVHTVHSLAEKEDNSKRLQNFFYHHMNLLPVAISPVVKTSVMEYYNLDDDQVPVVFNGLDVDSFRVKENYKILDEKFSFVHIGRFAEAKNHFNMIDAFAKFHKRYEDSQLFLIGDGPLMDEVRQRISQLQLGDDIIITGNVSNVSDYYEKADVFLLPSIYEGMPMTLIEAMGRGIPIIASDVGGIPDMITNQKDGLLCFPTVESILEKMYEMYVSYELREYLGKNALDRAKEFSSKSMCDNYISIYKKTMQK